MAYIVQIKDGRRPSWHEPSGIKCRFRSLEKAISLHDTFKKSALDEREQVRIWCIASDHCVELG